MGFFLASIGLDDHGLGDKIKVRMFYLVIQMYWLLEYIVCLGSFSRVSQGT